MCYKRSRLGEPWCSALGCCLSDPDIDDFQPPAKKQRKWDTVCSSSSRFCAPISPTKMDKICKGIVRARCEQSMSEREMDWTIHRMESMCAHCTTASQSGSLLQLYDEMVEKLDSDLHSSRMIPGPEDCYAPLVRICTPSSWSNWDIVVVMLQKIHSIWILYKDGIAWIFNRRLLQKSLQYGER